VLASSVEHLHPPTDTHPKPILTSTPATTIMGVVVVIVIVIIIIITFICK
jgi:hypothetical protein